MLQKQGFNLQLPVGAYVSERAYKVERSVLHDRLQYVGHVDMIPRHGDYRVLDFYNEGAKLIVNNRGSTHLLSNICRHRQAKMKEGVGNTSRLVCDYHKWSYALDGTHLTAPDFELLPCLNLEKNELYAYSGLLFENGRTDLDIPWLDLLSKYKYHSTKTYNYNVNWKTFLEVFLDNYHVGLFHNTNLGAILDCSSLTWGFGRNWSLQRVTALRSPKPKSAVYRNWLEQQAKYPADIDGAAWLSLYPTTTIEYYPHTAMVNNLVPTGPESCQVVIDTLYTNDVILDSEFTAAQQAAFTETASEDDRLCYAMQQGRRSLFARGINQEGPYHEKGEAGMEHFHKWYRSIINL